MPVTCTAVNKEIAYCSSFDFLKVSLQFASERGIHPLLYFRIDAFPFYYCVCVAYGNVGGCYNNAAVGAMVMIGFSSLYFHGAQQLATPLSVGPQHKQDRWRFPLPP